jgi:hypothetical protein
MLSTLHGLEAFQGLFDQMNAVAPDVVLQDAGVMIELGAKALGMPQK